MVNKVRGEADCKLTDGTEITLVVDFDALAHAEDAANMGVNDILANLNTSNPRMRPMRALIFGATRERNPELTLSDIGSLLLSEESAILSAALGKAVEGAFPQATGGAENPPAPSSGAGTTSSKTGRQKA